MDILKDIEKNILNINMYDKTVETGKLNLIKKQISDYFKYKSDENNIITQKMMKYEEEFKRPRELNNYEYELFLGKKEELYNIYRETKSLSSLYDYLNYKYENNKSIPEIYTYEHISLNERARGTNVVAKPANKNIDRKEWIQDGCPDGKVRNPITKRCVNDPSIKKVKNEEPKEPKVPKVPPKEPKVPKVPKVPKEPKEPKVPKEPKEPKVPKEPKEPKKPKVPK
jgi:hypothetical protein